jgi:hypothetical protein
MAATVGFTYAVRLVWMNKTAELVLEGKSPEQIRMARKLSWRINHGRCLKDGGAK